MSLWTRLARVFERRSTEEWGTLDPRLAAAFGLGPTSSGMEPTARTAENLGTLMACVSAIAGGCASLPPFLYRETPDGREEVDDHPLARMFRDGVNDRESWPDFLELLVANALLRGNGLAEIVTDGSGRLRELRSAPWEWVSARAVPGGRLVFDVSDPYGVYGEPGRMRRLLAGEVIHLKDRTDDSMLGRSRLSRAREVIGTGLAMQQFTGAMWKNGVHPSGVLEADGKIGDVSLKRLSAQFKEAFSGGHNAARAMVLDQGLKWKGISVSPEDAELLASRRFTTEELARLFNVPPPIVGIWDHSSFTNSETAGRWFAQFTLRPWLRKLETEFARAVLGRGYSLELDLSGMLRGDPETRWKSHEIALKNRVLSPNEIRLVEGWNPRPGGDVFDAPAPAPTVAGA